MILILFWQLLIVIPFVSFLLLAPAFICPFLLTSTRVIKLTCLLELMLVKFFVQLAISQLRFIIVIKRFGLTTFIAIMP